MHQPTIYRERTLPAGAVRLWDATEVALFTDPGSAGPPTGFPAKAQRARITIQVTGGTCWMTQNKVVAALNYGMLLTDGQIVTVGVPYHQLSFLKATLSPVVRMVLRGDL